MTVRFEHDEIETLLTELEFRTGRGREDVILDALRHARDRFDTDLHHRIAEGLKIDAEFRKRLNQHRLLDPRTPDDILAYDDNGLPV